MALKRNYFTAFKPASKPQKDISHSVTADEDTDFKLAILSSLHPDLSPTSLLELLLSCHGSVDEASSLATSPRKRPSTASGLIGNQSSLSTFFDKGDERTPKKIPYPPPPIPKGKTLHIQTPELVPYHTPCTLHPSFLPSQLATDLLRELLVESPSFPRSFFRLFDRNVSSPHSACFYVSDEYAVQTQRNDYLYNGVKLDDVRPFTPAMKAVVGLVEEKVNEEVERRAREVYPAGEKLRYQMKLGSWKVNTAFVNCYDGAKESVGWHSDQLTYLGPRAIIGSISLGVEREFRLRRVIARTTDESTASSTSPPSAEALSPEKESQWSQHEGASSIHLPHNSLLIMHAETQESWKHSVHPAVKITPHPAAGNKRISITYRCYRESLHPSRTPRCECGLATVLRCVQRQESVGRYFWMCHAGNAPDGKNCSFFKWAEFDDDGEPLWDAGGSTSTKSEQKKELARSSLS